MSGRIASVGAQVARALVVWAVDALSLLILAALLPGVSLASWRTALAAALVLGLLNAVLRPLVLLVAVNLGILLFTLIAFLLNAVVVLLASRWLPGFTVSGWGSAFAVAFGLALLNGLFTGLLSLNDQDTLYRNVTRRLARRRVEGAGEGRPGTVVVQIDGLAEPVLREDLAAGKAPTLARWLGEGTHRLVGWESAVPSMTSAVQAGLFYGDNSEIPAFRWFDKATGRLFVSNHPQDARALDARLGAGGGGLLAGGGVSISNLLTGGAGQSVLTMAGMVTEAGQRQIRARDFYSYEVAHHAGHASEDARRALRRFDRHLATIEDAARRAPRPYQLVALSDHGQSTGWTFKQRFGLSLGDLLINSFYNSRTGEVAAFEELIGCHGGAGGAAAAGLSAVPGFLDGRGRGGAAHARGGGAGARLPGSLRRPGRRGPGARAGGGGAYAVSRRREGRGG